MNEDFSRVEAKPAQTHEAHGVAPDILNPDVQRQRFFAQEPRILEAANGLAVKVKVCPADPKYPEHEPRALVVGGFVRDALLGKHPKDADLEVYGLSPERLKDLLEQQYNPEEMTEGAGAEKRPHSRVKTAGADFGIIKVALGQGIDLDVSIPRRESKIGTGHRGFEINSDPAMTIEEAARRRDFTMNAICADPITGEVFDPFGGISDIKNRLLRVTDRERFQDDPLRVLRAVQFVGRMGLTVDPDSFELMREMVGRGDMEQLTKERVTEEWKKLLLKAPQPSLGLDLVRRLGMIERQYPELKPLLPAEGQEPEAWKELSGAMDAMAGMIRMPDAAWTDDEKLAAMLAGLCLKLPSKKTLLNRFTFSKDVCQDALRLIDLVSLPGTIARGIRVGTLNEKQSDNELRKLMAKLYPLPASLLISFARTAEHNNETDDLLPIIERHSEWKLDPRSNEAKLVNGEDLIARGIKPGKEFGTIMKRIEQARDAGEIETREQALALFDQILKK